MIRKFNYTGRRKLSRERIDISIIDSKPFKSFSATLNLKGLGVADDAKVYIEPYFKSSFMRFPFGTVANLKVPENTSLSDIPSTSIIRFRVKVVDEQQRHGRIICIADKIAPKKPEQPTGNRMSILHIDWDQDLDQQIFRITFPDNEFPRLEINKKIDNAKEYLKSDQIFRSLVFPVVTRQVAEKLARTSSDFEEGDNSWQSTWLKFFEDVLHVSKDWKFGDDVGDDEIDHWIEEVVAAFCRKYKFRNAFEAHFR